MYLKNLKSDFMHLDSKFYIFTLFVLAFSIYLALSGPTITEEGYKELLLLKLTREQLDLVKISIPIFSFLSSLLIFQSKPENNLIAFLVSLLFIVSPLVLFNISYAYSLVTALTVFLFSLAGFLFFYLNSNTRYLFALPLLIGAYLAYSYLDYSFSLAKIKDLGIVLPLSAISIVLIIKDKIDLSVILFTLGLFSSFFLPSLSIVLLSFSSLVSLNVFLKHLEVLEIPSTSRDSVRRTLDLDDILFWAFFVLFLVIYILYDPIKENYLHAMGSAVAISLVAYFLLPLFNIAKHQNVFFVFLIVIGFSNSVFFIEQRNLSSISDREVGFFSSVRIEGSFGILDNKHAFEFYTGKKPKLLSVDDLLEKKELGVDQVLLSTNSLQKILGSRPVMFRLYSISAVNDGYSIDYVSGDYLLRLSISKDSKIISDGLLFDLRQGGQGRTVSFPKLKPFNSNVTLLEGNALINTENILDTNLYEFLFKKQVVSEALDIKLIKVG